MSGEAAWVVFDLDGTLIESEQIWRDVRHEFVIANGGRPLAGEHRGCDDRHANC
jgi:beta-phosphoglucomutase-like phosphatase (HAD superfamily)